MVFHLLLPIASPPTSWGIPNVVLEARDSNPIFMAYFFSFPWFPLTFGCLTLISCIQILLSLLIYLTLLYLYFYCSSLFTHSYPYLLLFFFFPLFFVGYHPTLRIARSAVPCILQRFTYLDWFTITWFSFLSRSLWPHIFRAKRVSNCYMQEKKNWPSVCMFGRTWF